MSATAIRLAPGVPEDYGARIDLADRTAKLFFSAGMTPRGYKVYADGKLSSEETLARMTVGILKGMDVGFAPAASLQMVAIFDDGKPAIYGDGASALLLASGLLDRIENENSGSWQTGDFSVTVKMYRRNGERTGLSVERTYTQAMATNAGLTKKVDTPWQTDPERQTYWRAWSWAARDLFSDVLGGLGIANEVMDFQHKADQPEKAKPNLSNLPPAKTLTEEKIQSVDPTKAAAPQEFDVCRDLLPPPPPLPVDIGGDIKIDEKEFIRYGFVISTKEGDN